MNRAFGVRLAGFVLSVVWVSTAAAQTPYIGYVYPAGGQQGTTFQVKLGGQRIDGTSGAVVSGEGVSAKLTKYYRRLSNQEMSLIREQLRELQRAQKQRKNGKPNREADAMIARIQKRIREWVNRPACPALSSIAEIEVTIAPDAKPGRREIRLISARGTTNPMTFYVGQVPEVTRKPMITATFQVLGKEAFAQRKRPPEEEEETVTVPCTMNGQIASGEINRYRFTGTKGQRLVVSVHARELVPYIADAVPGWFQPVVTLHDAEGTEVAFSDDFRFKPDPTLYFEVPRDGEYVLSITDAIYRGREDFVYRVTVGEVPFVTSIFPLGGRVGEAVNIEFDGWNLNRAKLPAPGPDSAPGIYHIMARTGPKVSNAMPFALDTLPEGFDKESNDDPAHAQQVELPIILNGRADEPGDWDVYQIEGQAGQRIVAEVLARRLDSPMDSMLKVTDSEGKVLAVNDDHRDAGIGVNTNHADSYLMLELPSDGVYYIHLGETTRSGGQEYAYRLRLSEPRPDFELRVVPSNVAFRSKSGTMVNIFAIRKDGFDGDIRLSLADDSKGFQFSTMTMPASKDMVKIGMRTHLRGTAKPVPLTIVGRAAVGDETIVRAAVPSEDRMQAFLWRHLVPAEELLATVFNPAFRPQLKRSPPELPDEMVEAAKERLGGAPTFTQRQVEGRLRQLRGLFEEWLLTDSFYNRKVAECKASL